MANKNNKLNNDQNQASFFESLGFTPDKALEILKTAKAQEEKTETKNTLIKQASESIVFMKSSEYDKYFDKEDTKDVYCLLYTYDKTKKNSKEVTKDVTALHKKSSFFIELARMSAGSKLAEAINAVLNPAPAKA